MTRTRKRTLRISPTLAHIQAYERRFGPIDGPTFRDLRDALTVVHGGHRFQLHTFREALKESLLNDFQRYQDISALSKQLQHSSTEVTKRYYATQKL